MEYLITGATGNVGSKVVELLVQKGERPRVFVRDLYKTRARFGDRVDTFVGDLADPESMEGVLGRGSHHRMFVAAERRAQTQLKNTLTPPRARRDFFVFLPACRLVECLGTSAFLASLAVVATAPRADPMDSATVTIAVSACSLVDIFSLQGGYFSKWRPNPSATVL
jgi:uncharacterized protein YbjT (DUF2867 family)